MLKHFGSSLEEIREKGEAQVTLAGRRFSIRHDFIVDAEEHRLADRIRSLGKALLVMRLPPSAEAQKTKIAVEKYIPRIEEHL